MTPEKKMAWIEMRLARRIPAHLRLRVGKVWQNVALPTDVFPLLAHFERRMTWMRETNGPSSNGERAEIDSMAEALGWTK